MHGSAAQSIQCMWIGLVHIPKDAFAGMTCGAKAIAIGGIMAAPVNKRHLLCVLAFIMLLIFIIYTVILYIRELHAYAWAVLYC